MFAASFDNSVTNTRELRRILELPQRDPEEQGIRLVEFATSVYKTEGGTQTLRPLQALALAELQLVGGVICMMPVGQGKTLVSFLGPVKTSKTPLLLIPAEHKTKTEKEFEALCEHWKSHKNYKIATYEKISRNPELLENISPDMLVLDEAHRLKNPKSGVTRRVGRYLKANPETKVIVLTGTLTKRSLRDWYRLQQWTLPEKLNVLPKYFKELEDWALALDEKPEFRKQLGALRVFGKDLQSAREGYGQHIRRVPGIIGATAKKENMELSILLVDMQYTEIDRWTRNAHEKWETPDGG